MPFFIKKSTVAITEQNARKDNCRHTNLRKRYMQAAIVEQARIRHFCDGGDARRILWLNILLLLNRPKKQKK